MKEEVSLLVADSEDISVSVSNDEEVVDDEEKGSSSAPPTTKAKYVIIYKSIIWLCVVLVWVGRLPWDEVDI